METTNTIKGIEVIAYKGMNSDMTYKGFQYEIGKTYKTDKAKLCEYGFHACLNPRDVLDYYSQSIKSRYFKVKLSGDITKCGMWDTNVAATEITILEEINIDEVIETTEWWKTNNVLNLLYYQENFARVQRANGDWNFIDANGNYLFNEWFYWLGNFCEGFARVARTNGEWNFIDKDGNYLFNEWFYYLENFNDGLAKVRRSDEKYNFIDIKGKILSKQWFNYAYFFNNGLAKVEREDYLYNLIDRQGDILSNKWFDYVDDFKAGFARVKRSTDKLWNFIGEDGKIISDEWFRYVDDFRNGLARVKRTNGEWAKIDKTGKLIKNLQ